MSLRAAFGLSVAIHLGLMAVHPPEGAVPPREALHSIELTYLRLQPASKKEESSSIEPLPVRKESTPAERQAPSSSAQSQAVVKEREPEKRTTGRADPPTARAEPKPAPVPQVTSSGTVEAVPKGMAAGFSESQILSVQYKQLVRQHLKTRLTYPQLSLEGTVRLRIILDSEGQVQQVVALETSDAQLAEVALEGARSATPYPRFPKGLKETQADMEFLIQYRLD